MSTSPDRPVRPLLLAALTAVDTETATREAEARRLTDQRAELFRSVVIEPVTPLADHWAAAWENLAGALAGFHVITPVAALGELQQVLGELQQAATAAAAALDRWYSECAEPYNARYPEHPLSRVWNARKGHPLEGHWLETWARTRPDPALVPRLVAESAMSLVWRPGPDSFVAALYELLGTSATTEEFERALALIDSPRRLAAVCPVLAAVILPAPGLIEGFFDNDPGPDALALALKILAWCPETVRGSLERELGRCEREYHEARPSAFHHSPADHYQVPMLNAPHPGADPAALARTLVVPLPSGPLPITDEMIEKHFNSPNHKAILKQLRCGVALQETEIVKIVWGKDATRAKRDDDVKKLRGRMEKRLAHVTESLGALYKISRENCAWRLVLANRPAQAA